MLGKSLKKFLKIGVPLLVVVALAAGLAVPALADQNGNFTKPAPLNTIKGKVVQLIVANTSFTLQTAEGATTTVITVDSNTKYFKITPGIKVVPKAANKQEKPLKAVPPGLSNKELPKGLKDRVLDVLKGKKDVKRGLGDNDVSDEDEETEVEQLPEINDQALFGLEGNGNLLQRWFGKFNWLRQRAANATFADIAVGDTVIVRTLPNEKLAKLVLIVKEPQINIKKVAGIITITGPNSFIITPTGGTAVPITWNTNTQFVLHGLMTVANGQYAVAVVNADGLAKTVNVWLTAPTTTNTTVTQTTY